MTRLGDYYTTGEGEEGEGTLGTLPLGEPIEPLVGGGGGGVGDGTDTGCGEE